VTLNLDPKPYPSSHQQQNVSYGSKVLNPTPYTLNRVTLTLSPTP